MAKTFAVAAPDLRLLMLAPALGLFAGLGGLALAAREEPRVWWMLIPIVLVCALIAAALRRREVALDGGHLRIAAALHTLTVSVDRLDLASAKIVDLAEARDLRPFWKTFGTSAPGLRAGHFRLRDRTRAFALVTRQDRVLVLPEREGRILLLSLERPQALLDALRAVAGGGRGR